MDDAPAPGRSGPPEGHERVLVARFGSRVMADLARSMLLDAGIAAVVTADDAGGLHPELPLVTGGVGVSVPPADLRLARSLLEGDPSVDANRSAGRHPPASATSDGGAASHPPRPRRTSWAALGTVALLVALVVFVLVDLVSG